MALHTASNEVKAVGAEAKRMLGKSPKTIKAIHPLRDGVISDFEVAHAMLSYFIKKVSQGKRGAAKVIVAVPSGITTVEKKAVEDAALQAGAKDVIIVMEPMAAAIGVGLPIEDAMGNMVIDIGGGTTEVAVVSLAGLVVDTSIKVAGNNLDQAILAYLRQEYQIVVGRQTAEDIKIRIASAFELDKELELEVKGRDLVTGLPVAIKITSTEIREAIAEPIKHIVDATRGCLGRCPAELSADISNNGIVLAGGGALIKGLDKLMKKETGLKVNVAEDPLSAVVEGTGRLLEDPRLLAAISEDF